MAREIEIKCKLHNKAVTLEALKKLGIKLEKPKKQHDVVFGRSGAIENGPDSDWLRIRTEDDAKVIFTLKRPVIGHLDSIEHETIVENADELEAIIKLLGFELYSDLTKIRRKGKYGDIEVCIDEVSGLGEFIEAELIMEHDSDHAEVIGHLWEFFGKLELSKKDEIHEGYDILNRRQQVNDSVSTTSEAGGTKTKKAGS